MYSAFFQSNFEIQSCVLSFWECENCYLVITFFVCSTSVSRTFNGSQ